MSSAGARAGVPNVARWRVPLISEKVEKEKGKRVRQERYRNAAQRYGSGAQKRRDASTRDNNDNNNASSLRLSLNRVNTRLDPVESLTRRYSAWLGLAPS